MTSIDEARRAVQRFSGIFKKKTTQFFGVLGNGSGVVTGTRSNTVLVRIGSAPPVEVFNMAVPPVEGLPIVVGYDQNPSLIEVLGVDKTRVTDWLEYNYVAPHGHSHTYGDSASGYADIVYIQKRQFIPLMCIPTTPPSMQLTVLSDFYPYGSTWKYFSGATTVSLSSYRPSSGQARFVTIYINAETNALGYATNSLVYTTLYPPDNVRDYIPTPPEGSIPIAAVVLTGSGEARIVEDDIYDVRLIYNSLGGTSTPAYNDSGDPATLHANLSAYAGLQSFPARRDHRHALNLFGSGIPSGIAYGPRRGVSPWAAREDHVHHLPSGLIPGWAIAAEAITSYHIGSGVIKQYHLDAGISIGGGSGTSSSGGGHLHGLSRWNVYSGLATLDLPDYAEYLEGVSNFGYELDPINYALTASGDKIQFSPPFSASGLIVAHYVISQI